METTPIIDHNKTDYGSQDPAPSSSTPAANTDTAKLNIVNLSYTVKERKGPWYEGLCFRPWVTKKVLKNVDMSINSGQVTAILGSSGSGKTSLLDVVSHRHDGDVTGNVYFKNYISSKDLMMACSSYVMQADRLLTHLTVRESLRYTANFCLPQETTSEEIETRIESVIREIGLIKVADSFIGGLLVRGLSGGEKRRVSVAMQLLKNPEILILDEPTTGLDSFTARYLVKNLHDLSRTGKIVLMTIHQPRSDIFKYFDQVAIMCLGEVTYFGPSDELVPHFTRLNFPCPIYANPLDNYIDVCSIDRRTKQKEEDSTKRVQDLVKAYKESPQHDAMVASMTDSMKVPKYVNFSKKLAENRGPGIGRTMKSILGRMNLNMVRDKNTLITRIISTPVTLILVVVLLGRLDEDQKSVQDRGGLFFHGILAAHVEGFLLPIFTFPNMRDLYYRDTRDGYYKWWQFLSCHTAHTFPFHVIATALAGAMLYWICGLYEDFGLFMEFITVNIFICMMVEACTVCALGIIYDFQVVNMLMTMVNMLSVVVSSGLFRTIHDLPEAIKWVSFLTPVRYGTEIIVGNEYTNINITCDSGDDTPCKYPTSDAYLHARFPHAESRHDDDFGWMALTTFVAYVILYTVYKFRKIPNLH